jgi:hypothetical protein
MQTKWKAILFAPLAGLVLGGCAEISSAFLTGDPALFSTCEHLLGGPVGGSKIMCVECNSGDSELVNYSTETCGVVISARCNSDVANDVYGVALGGFDVDSVNFSVLTATAWYDADGDGPDSGDVPVCHEQSGALVKGKQEYKCTTSLIGSGVDDTTFEVEVTYDESLDDCV